MPLIEMPIVAAMTVPETDTTLALCSLSPSLAVYSRDGGKLAKNGTVTGGCQDIEGNGATLDGTDGRIAYGDLGVNLIEVSLWVNPGPTSPPSEQLFRVDTGKSVAILAGTITYTGLVASATYVDGAAGTTMVASKWQHVVCQFGTMDANLFDLGYDGAAYGDIEARYLCGRTAARSAAEIAYEYNRIAPDPALVLAVDGRGRDLSRYKRTVTASGGPILGNRIELDGTDGMLDAGDCGNIQEVSLWVNPTTNGEQLFRVDTGKSVSLSGGTITYTGLTATATYVNGVAGTTVAAGYPQSIVCQFETTDANNLELGTDGAAYGLGTYDRWCARDTSRSAGAIAIAYAQERGEY